LDEVPDANDDCDEDKFCIIGTGGMEGIRAVRQFKNLDVEACLIAFESARARWNRFID